MAGAESQRYWDERARENAVFFVDNELDYENPDLEDFWRRGDTALDLMLDAVGLTIGPDEDIADIGCGVGRMSRALAGRARRVYGVDVSSGMLAQAREHNRHVENVEWLHGDGETLGVLADDSVDGCFSHVVFQHIPDPKITLNYVGEMGRVLRPGGWALFQVSSDPGVHRPPAPSLRRRVKGLLKREPRHEAAWWGSAVDPGELRRAAADGGLDVVQILDEGTQYTTVYLRR